MAPPSRVEVVVHHQMAAMAGLDAISPEEEVGCQVVLGKMVCAMLGEVDDQLVAGKMMGVDGGGSLDVGSDVVVLGVSVGGAFLWKPAQPSVVGRCRSRPPGDKILL